MTLKTYFDQFIVFYFRVSDMQRSLAFYEEKLGFKPIFISDDGGWAELSFGTHQRPHLGLNLYSGEGPLPTNAGGIPSFEVQDIQRLKAEVERLDIPHEGVVEYESWDHFQFLWVFDPDGNKIEFVKLGPKYPEENTPQGG